MIENIFTNYFETYLYLFMFLIPFIAQIGIPIGAMFFILYSGSIVTGNLQLSYLFPIILTGTLSGDILSYSFARKFSQNKLINKYLKNKKINKIHDKASLFLNKNGVTSIFITRFLITGIGPYLNYILGLQKYNFKKFFIFILAGEIIYTIELLLIGSIFKETFEEILDLFIDFSYIILILIILYYIGKHIFKSEFKKTTKKKQTN